MQRVQGIPDTEPSMMTIQNAARVSDEQAVLGHLNLAIGRDVERAVPIEATNWSRCTGTG